MTKRIPVYEPLGDENRDRGEESRYLVFDKNGMLKNRYKYNNSTLKEYPLSDIVRVDCFRTDEVINNMASGAAKGFLINGTRGAIVGGLLSSGQRAWWVEIELKDESLLYFRLRSEVYKNDIFQWANKYNVTVAPPEVAEEPEETESNTTAPISSADEILKYKSLLDRGIITQEEFEAKKEQLLNL